MLRSGRKSSTWKGTKDYDFLLIVFVYPLHGRDGKSCMVGGELMIIYLSDKPLSLDSTRVILDERNEYKHVIVVNGKNGFKRSENFVNELNKFHSNISIITNIPYFMSAKYGWNEKHKQFDIYIECKSGEFKNIHELTDRELRKEHNLCNLYIAGEFDEGIRNN